MVEASALPLPYPEAATVQEATLEAQTAAVAAALPRPTLVLGGCCCAHIGAIRGLAERHGRLAVVWLDAHGDLNTPQTSPSGNAWGMPLRMALDEGSTQPDRVALVGARNLDPPEAAYLAAEGIDDGVDRALHDADAVYVALDVDVVDSRELACFMPEPGGLTVAEVTAILARVRAAGLPIAGVGFTGVVPATDLDTLAGLAAALGL
jgi:arginase